MKRSCIILMMMVLALGFLVTTVTAEKAATLEEIMKPNGVSIGEDRLFITEGVSIYVYSLEDFKLIKKFGKSGEGPQEFKLMPMGPPLVIAPRNGKLYVSSIGKVSEYTLDGEFIKETKVTPFQTFTPFGDQYMYTGFTSNEKKENLLAINLADGKFQKIKELMVTQQKVGPSVQFELPFTPFDYAAYKDRIYILEDKGEFAISVFDKTGKRLHRIKKEFQPLKVSDKVKKMHKTAFEKDPGVKAFWQIMKDRVHFKDVFPPARSMSVLDGRIYLLTFKKKKGKSQCLILDLKGKQVGEVYVTCADNLGLDFYSKFAWYKGHFYALLENDDDDVWELHRTPLK